MKLIDLYQLIKEEKGKNINQLKNQGYYTVKGTDEEGREWDYVYYLSGFQEYNATLEKIAGELRNYVRAIGVSEEVKKFAKDQLTVVNTLMADLKKLDATIKVGKKNKTK